MRTPEISVIIPVYNDPEGIADTLDSLLEQSLPWSAYEVLVVDNGSSDRTVEVINDYAHRYADLVFLLTMKNIRSSYAARNTGAARAKGPMLAFLDADVTVGRNYLAAVLNYLTVEGLEYLGCRVEVVPRGGTLASKYDAIHAFPTEKYFEYYRFVPTCCLSICRELLERLGPFNDRLESGGDTEFSVRAERARVRKGFARDITVRHPARENYASLLNKRMRLGRGAAQLNHLDPIRFAPRRFSFVEHVLPSNPLRIGRDASERGIPISVLEAMLMSTFKLPLTWAHLAAYARESRRLKRGPDRPAKAK